MKRKNIFYPILAAGTIACVTAKAPNAVNSGLNPYLENSWGGSVHCIENNMPTIFQELQPLFNIKSRKRPDRRYLIMEKYAAHYEFTKNRIAFDTVDVTRYNCKKTIYHELTHHILDMIGRNFGHKYWPNYSTNDTDKFTIDDRGMKMINEGIAEYIEMGGVLGDTATWWPDSITVGAINYYLHGYTLVRPIMDEFGPISAWYMVLMAPKGKEIFFPEGWRKKVKQGILQDSLGKMIK